jgi:hypothetical protein
MDDNTVSDEHPPSKTESAFNRFVARQPDRAPFPVGNPRQGDMARRLTQHGPALPWYANAFSPRTYPAPSAAMC